MSLHHVAGARACCPSVPPCTVDEMEKLKEFFRTDRFVEHSGIEPVSLELGRATARMLIKPMHMNALGIVQGGAIFTLADYAFGMASNSHGLAAVGINVSITYMKAAVAGVLTAEARELSRNAKLGSYTVEVKNEAGELVAVFQGLVYRKKDVIPPLG